MASDFNKYSALLRTLLDNNAAFALIRRPHSEVCEMVDHRDFSYLPWRGESRNVLPFDHERQPSTNREDYLREVSWLISTHKRRGGKTVISRVIDISAHIDIPGVAEGVFERNPDAMCALFNSPQTGCWLVASPEVLVSVNRDDMQTMALAGTRPAGTAEPWDEKNLKEQEIVTRFIEQNLDKLGIPYITEGPETLVADGVEHLCTHFDARLPQGIDARRVANTLNPTPALCGSPRDTAMFDIGVAEKHKRQMYGGYFAVTSGEKFDAYVMVRCARLWADGANVFAGGGITAQSNPEAEWEETALKAQPMLTIIKQNSIKINEQQ